MTACIALDHRILAAQVDSPACVRQVTRLRTRARINTLRFRAHIDVLLIRAWHGRAWDSGGTQFIQQHIDAVNNRRRRSTRAAHMHGPADTLGVS